MGKILPGRVQRIRNGLAGVFGYYSRLQPYAGENVKGQKLDNGNLEIAEAFYPLTDVAPMGPRNRFVVAHGVYSRDPYNNNDKRAYVAFQNRQNVNESWETFEVWSGEMFSDVLKNLESLHVLKPMLEDFINENRKANRESNSTAENKNPVTIHISPDPIRKAVNIIRGYGMTIVDPELESIWRFYDPAKAGRVQAYSLIQLNNNWYVNVEEAQSGKLQEQSWGWRELYAVPLDNFLHKSFRKAMGVMDTAARWTLPLDPADAKAAAQDAAFNAPEQVRVRDRMVTHLRARDIQVPIAKLRNV